MSLINKNWHENVMAALELVREEVVRADKQIRFAGSKEMAQGDKETARLALAYSDKLDGFMFELEKVGDKWQEIQETIDADKPEVQEVVLPTKVRESKGGYKRTVSDMAPWTNFTVRYANAPLIEEATAKATFAKALAQFDLEKVEKLGVMLNGEPLVSRSRKAYVKYPQSVVSVKDGWFASTYCSTATKAKFIREFAKKFGIKAEVTIIPHKMKNGTEVSAPVAKPMKTIVKGDKPKSMTDGRIVEGVPYKVSQVVCACFPEVFKRGLVTAEEVAYLQTKESSRQFRTGGNPVIKLDCGNDADRIKVSPTGFKKARFYPATKVSLQFAGKKYYLSCEFAPNALSKVVDWLESKGVLREELVNLVKSV